MARADRARLSFSHLFLARTAVHPRRALGGRRLVRAICGSHIQDPPTHPYLGLLGFRILAGMNLESLSLIIPCSFNAWNHVPRFR